MFCADVDNRSFTRTRGCFLSSLLCKDGITLGKGKDPKVPSAVAWAIPPHKGGCPRPTMRREPVVHNPEGRWVETPTSLGPLSGH